ncbi:MAG: peptidoglycan editing factor PgeF [Clostridiales bacterium]|jgi:YfiH family protein|nr:peptidoglycan editing factor PgeF [Clostridiales bacterium]
MSFTLIKNGELEYMTCGIITVPHAFTTRRGGKSRGIYSSLNLRINSDDEREAVRYNYETICGELGTSPEKLVFSRQVHKDAVRAVTSADCHKVLFSAVPYEADGLITCEKGLPLVIFIADCIPILLYDPTIPAIGAVHAGWRGTVLDITGKAIAEMKRHYGSRPENIRAAIGQGIDFCCFETGPEVPRAVRELLGKDAEAFIKPRGQKSMVNLKGINRFLLERRGVLPSNIEVSDECTFCLSEKYWSHRVTRGERGVSGAFIMI